MSRCVSFGRAWSSMLCKWSALSRANAALISARCDRALRHVAQEGARVWVDLFGEKPDIVGQRDGAVHELAGPLGLAGLGEGIDHPEAARDERALFLVHAAVAVEERAVARVRWRWRRWSTTSRGPRSKPVRPARSTAASRSSVPA